jgi:hypothetical protein
MLSAQVDSRLLEEFAALARANDRSVSGQLREAMRAAIRSDATACASELERAEPLGS